MGRSSTKTDEQDRESRKGSSREAEQMWGSNQVDLQINLVGYFSVGSSAARYIQYRRMVSFQKMSISQAAPRRSRLHEPHIKFDYPEGMKVRYTLVYDRQTSIYLLEILSHLSLMWRGALNPGSASFGSVVGPRLRN